MALEVVPDGTDARGEVDGCWAAVAAEAEAGPEPGLLAPGTLLLAEQPTISTESAMTGIT